METRLLIWLFPHVMAMCEYLLRTSMNNADALGFYGPTLGAASLGMLLPLTRAKEVSRRRRKTRFGNQVTVVFDIYAERKAGWANLALWIGLAAWMASVYVGIGGKLSYFPALDGLRTGVAIGAILWLSAVILDMARGGD